MSGVTTYRYLAVDRAGAKRRGTVSAPSELDACRRVAAQGLTPVDVRPDTRRRTRGRIKQRDVAHFTYQLSVLLAARIPIGDGLRSIAEQEPNQDLRRVLVDLADRIEAGEQIAAALRAHPEVFDDIYTETVLAAEKSGNLIKVLEYLAQSLEGAAESRQQLRAALAYPACVASFLGLATIFLVGFIIPRFSAMYEQRGIDLPAITQALVAVGKSIRGYWWIYLLAIGGSIWGLRRAWSIPAGRHAIDRFLHRLPGVRGVLVSLAIARFARVLGLCISSGLGIMEALSLAGRASGRPMLAADAETMVLQVRAGGRLSEVLGTCRYLTPFARRMLSAGEESAEMSRMCGIVARQYERDAASTTKNLTTILEPLLVVLITGTILIVSLAIFLPMWDMVNLMR